MPIVSIHQRGYMHPELLAEADWLAEQLNDPNVHALSMPVRPSNMAPTIFLAR